MALPHAKLIRNHWGVCLIGFTATLYFCRFPCKSLHVKVRRRFPVIILNNEDLDLQILLQISEQL